MGNRGGEGWGVGGDTGVKNCVDTSSTQGDVMIYIIPGLNYEVVWVLLVKNILRKNKILRKTRFHTFV